MKNKKPTHQNGRSRQNCTPCRKAFWSTTAFTLVELLAVLGIIAILVALLIPALTAVRTMAKETQQRAQITTIEMALTAFRNDYGDYPPSHGYSRTGSPEDYARYCGAQTLAEALVGWDLTGFHPDSAWTADGEDKAGSNMVYLDGTEPPAVKEANLKKRKGPYLELATANVFKLDTLFGAATASFDPYNCSVICDVFGIKSVSVGSKVVKAGSPILYYKANTSSKTITLADVLGEPTKLIYNYMDNHIFIRDVKEPADELRLPTKPTPVNPLATSSVFYNYIADPKVTTAFWPSRPDSYLLISAGADGLYGTEDDIGNFDPNSPG